MDLEIMTPRNEQLKRIRGLVNSKWGNPNARLLQNHYKFVRKIVKDEYPKSLEGISDDTIEDILKTVVYADRYLRNKRQGTQKELKRLLSKEFVPTLK